MIHLPNKAWVAIEIKLGGEQLVEEGVWSLNRLKNKLVEKAGKKPILL